MHSEIKQREPRERLVPLGGIDLQVSDMTATFSGDVMLAAAQAKLAEVGQWIPFDGDESLTLAELVENNSTGPLRLGFGGWRDNLLGVQFENGRGELISAGGRVLKNVAGYDFTRFMVGSYGCFGKVQTITTRTYVRPALSILAAFDPVIEKLNALLVTSCRPHWAVLTPDALLLGYLGDERTVAYYEQTLKSYSPDEVLVHTLADDISARSKLWNQPQGSESFQAMVPPAKIGQFVKDGGITNWTADAAFGIVKASGTFDAATVGNAAVNAGGSTIFFDASGRPKNLKLDPTVKALLEKLKTAFDPDSKLEPLPV